MDQRESIKRSIDYAESREAERKRPFDVPGWMDGAVPLGVILLVVGFAACVIALIYYLA